MVRDCGIIELLIDCLRYPNYSIMNEVLTLTCKMIYELLTVIVKNSEINKKYTSIWIDLFLIHSIDKTEFEND